MLNQVKIFLKATYYWYVIFVNCPEMPRFCFASLSDYGKESRLFCFVSCTLECTIETVECAVQYIWWEGSKC